MAKQTVNIGATPNDGTGDPIRDAFDKVNQNFDELYSSYVASGQVSVGNSTVNTVISNTGGLVTSNSTVSTVANTSAIKIGNTTANVLITLQSISVYGNSAAGNASLNTVSVSLGNSTVNSSLSQNTLSVVGATTSATLNSTAFFLGNSAVNANANSSTLTIASVNNTTNTFGLGSSSVGSSNFANGYSRLPNGLLMQWGYNAAVNSTANVVTFASVGGVAFTNLFSVSATSTTANHVFVSAANSTTVTLVCNTAANTGVYWTAIGK